MRIIRDNINLVLSQNIPFLVYSLLAFNDITYSKIATAVNRNYCCDLDVFLYQKIIRLSALLKAKTLLNRNQSKEQFLKDRLERVLDSKEKILFNNFINKYDNGELLLPYMKHIDNFKNGNISEEDYMNKFLYVE